MRKVLTILASATLAGAMLAGCGSEQAPAAPAPTVTVTETVAPPVLGPVAPRTRSPFEHGPGKAPVRPVRPPGVYEHGPASNTR
jgi:hypothetical protein